MGSSLSTRLWLVGRPTGLHGITGCFDVGHWAENSERQLPILTQHWNLYQLEVELRAAALIHYTGLQKLNIFYWLRKRERKKEEKKPEGIITTTSTNTSPRMVSHLELYDYFFSISDLVSFDIFAVWLLSAKNGDDTALHLQITQYTALTEEKFDKIHKFAENTTHF